MNTTYKYDPEDIESLLMHKQFNELYPEEKEFVLRHVEGPEEYDSLRQTLFLMHDAADQDEWLEPDPSIRKNLMAQFVREEKKGFFVWLNGLFAAPFLPEVSWHKQPALRYALASVAVIAVAGGIWIYTSNSGDGGQLAVVESVVDQGSKELDQQATGEMAGKEKRTYADNLKPNVFPPAPAPIDQQMKYPNVEYIPTEESAMEMINEGNISDENKYFEFTPTVTGDATDDVSLAEPSLSPVTSEKSSLFKKNDEVSETLKKEATREEDMANNEKLDLEEAKDKTTDQEKEEAVTVTSVGADRISAQSSAPVTLNGATPTSDGMMTSSGTYTIAVTDATTTYIWNAESIAANSRNAADLKSVVSILFTAK